MPIELGAIGQDLHAAFVRHVGRGRRRLLTTTVAGIVAAGLCAAALASGVSGDLQLQPATPLATQVTAAPAASATGVAASAVDRPQGLLAFHADPGGDSGLYVMSADGSGVRLASANLAGHPFGKWSPDGTRVAFLSGSSGEGALRVLEVRSRRERGIGNHTVRAFDWSPDGTSLVYEASDGTMWITKATGPDRPRRLGKGRAPDWSPHGRWIAYVGFANRGDIFKVAARGTRPIRLTRHPAADHTPQWSPTGTAIAFISERDGNTELYLFSADGSRTRRLTRDPAPDESFQWAPDGRRIAYVSYRAGAEPTSIGIGNAEIRTIDLRTGRIAQISNHPAWDGDPAWSPDGRWIAFTRRAGYGEIGVMRSDGSEKRLLRGAVSAPFNDCCPSWRPRRGDWKDWRDRGARVFPSAFALIDRQHAVGRDPRSRSGKLEHALHCL